MAESAPFDQSRSLAALARRRMLAQALSQQRAGNFPNAPYGLLGSLFNVPQPGAATSLLTGNHSPRMWIYVERRFRQFLDALAVSASQISDGDLKHAGVRSCLNRYYWNFSSPTANSMLIGSWGKNTRIAPTRDIDILFLLPGTVFSQYQMRSGNRQSQLLQDVRGALGQTYSQSTMRADGQVIQVLFNSILVEVAVGFDTGNGSFIVCDTNSGGTYKSSTAPAEVNALDYTDTICSQNARPLARMLKQWARANNVSIKSFQIERLACEFLVQWPHRTQGLFWYDWMIRDFFSYLIGRSNSFLFMPGTREIVALGDQWLSAAKRAHQAAIEACQAEHNNSNYLAGGEWQKIFGSKMPEGV